MALGRRSAGRAGLAAGRACHPRPLTGWRSTPCIRRDEEDAAVVRERSDGGSAWCWRWGRGGAGAGCEPGRLRAERVQRGGLDLAGGDGDSRGGCIAGGRPVGARSRGSARLPDPRVGPWQRRTNVREAGSRAPAPDGDRTRRPRGDDTGGADGRRHAGNAHTHAPGQGRGTQHTTVAGDGLWCSRSRSRAAGSRSLHPLAR